MTQETIGEFKKYWFHNGNWHDAECAFVCREEGVCNCDYDQNLKVVSSLFTNQLQKVFKGIKKGCEFDKVEQWKGKGYSPSYLSGYQKAYEEVKRTVQTLQQKYLGVSSSKQK